MAFWNAPLDTPDHRTKACEALLAMREKLELLNKIAPWHIEIGIGLNTGACCVGNLGSSQRFNYSAIGDAVNVATRVEGQTKLYGLDNLLAQETLEGTEGFATLQVDTIAVVGRNEPLIVHTLLGDATLSSDASFLALRDHHSDKIKAWRSGNMNAARVAMQATLETAEGARKALGKENPNFAVLTKLHALYAERIDALQQDGVPEGWDGIYRATSK